MEEENQIKNSYPLHFAILKNDIEILNNELQSRSNLKDVINKPDVHGRTPVMLATMLGRLDLAELLLDHGADANTQNKEMWSLSHEAILKKDSNFLTKVLTLRDYQRALQTTQILRETNANFRGTPDFYVEMAWEFTSWLPFIKSMCPSDTYKIYKHGSNIRIDANMLEITSKDRATDKNKSSDQSFIFRFPSDELAEIIFIDRNEGIAYVQNLELQAEPAIEEFIPTESMVMQKIKTPITTTYVDVENVGFERSQKSLKLLSWIGSNDKEEEIEGYTCRVFTASNVEIVTKTCFDHLTEAEREEASKEDTNKTLSILMSLFEKKRVDVSNKRINNGVEENDELDADEYLGKQSDTGKHIGAPREEHIKTNSFNASLWLSESFPLNLREVFPIIDLMAVRNTKFSRLKRFIQLQMPSGFPIRIKIPIFHLINAQITFRNINEPGQEALEVSNDEETDFHEFKLEQSLFDIPEGFERREMTGALLFNRMDEVERVQTGQDLRYHTVDVEDGGEYVYLLERFIGDQIPQTSTYEQQLQIAIEESLAANQSTQPRDLAIRSENDGQGMASSEQTLRDDELLKALELSKMEEERRRKEIEDEEEELRIALERSMVDQ